MNNTDTLLESIISDLIKAEKTIISKDKRLFNIQERNLIPGWLLYLIVLSYIWIFILAVVKYIEGAIFGLLLLIPVIVIFYGTYRDNIYSKITTVAQEKIQSILKKHHSLFNSFDKTESIDEIVSKLETMRLLISEDLGYLKQKRLRVFKNLVKKEILFCTSVLYDLRSDLSLRLTEQQSTLEQAKSEVSTHIHGTDELNQVSELQKQRLDQQIEQFEELQRVLVKS